MASTATTALRPICKGGQFDLPVPGIQYYPEHPLMKQLNETCTHKELGNIQALVTQWQRDPPASPPRSSPHYPMGTLEPTLFYAIRSDLPDVVNYPLDEGGNFSGLALAEAVTSQVSPAMLQVFHDHGLDINAPLEDAGSSPWPPNLWVSDPSQSELNSDERLAVLRYLLDAGANPDAPKWAHNSRSYGSDFEWGSALNTALTNGPHRLAEELLRRGARTDVSTMNNHMTGRDGAGDR